MVNRWAIVPAFLQHQSYITAMVSDGEANATSVRYCPRMNCVYVVTGDAVRRRWTEYGASM